MSRYFLSRNSFACETGGHAVFLNLDRDKYTAVAPEDLMAIRLSVRGWPAHGERARTYVSEFSSDDEVVRTLMQEGLLTEDPSYGKEATPAQIFAPTETLAQPERPSPKVRYLELFNFVSAWATTTLMLRVLPIGRIVNRVRLRKLRETKASSGLDMQKARWLTAIHSYLQPIFYSGNDACLRNALTLVEFLARYDVYPTWAFGVRMAPFSAHSWVQHEDVLFTDPVYHVKRFTPIMLI